MRRFMSIAAAIFALSAILCGCGKSDVSDGDSAEISVGSVELVCDGESYAPLENWIFAVKDGLAADGFRRQPEDVADELETIFVSDNVQIAVKGEMVGNPFYTLYRLYDDSCEAVYDTYGIHDEFVMPKEPGKYILLVQASWGGDEEHVGFQYFFMIERLGE